MKRIISLYLLLCLLTGCSSMGERLKEPVNFYYVRENYREEMGEVISPEVREASGHRYDLPYLLALYSLGPSQEDLHSLLPRNTTILPTERTPHSVELTLSENTQAMTDADFTLTSACLAMTCMELLDIRQVTVISGDRNITLREDNLMLYNSIVQKPQEETK
jgi:spore germination protein GerM